METLRQVTKALADEPGPLASVLISVDGERDTPAALEAYLAPFQPNFIGVTGPPQVVRDVANDFSAVFFKGMPADTKGGYDVEHTSQVYLVDRDARLRATFYNAPTDAMVALVRQVMHEK
jgi:protein SCO1/2